MVPSSFRSYSAVVLFRSRSNLKSSLALSYHVPRYFVFFKGMTATAPLGMVAHDEKRIPARDNNMMEIVFPVFIMLVLLFCCLSTAYHSRSLRMVSECRSRSIYCALL